MSMKGIMCRARVVLPIIATSIIMVACGSGGGEEGKTSSILKLGFMGVIMAFVTIPTAMSSVVKLIKSTQSQQRGTNAVTKFIRHSTGHHVQKKVLVANGGVAGFDLIFTFMGFSIPKLLITLLPIGVIIGSFMAMQTSTKSKERVKSARIVTKGTMQVGAATAKGVAGTAAIATGGVAGAAIVAGAGVAGAVMNSAQKNMEVEGFKDMDQEAIASGVTGGISSVKTAALQQATAKIQNIADTELFKQKALRLGCSEDMSLGEMAEVVLRYAPEVSLKQLPDGLSPEEKAVAVLGAFKQQNTKALPQKDKPTIDGKFREVST